MFDRRQALTATLAACLSPGAAGAASPMRAAARELALYALPMIELAGTRGRAFRNGLAANRFRHARTLTNARTQTVTQPNNDTLYSSAWLDLSQGPVRITLPDTGDRYLSLALMDMFSNNFEVVSGGPARTLTLVGPNAATPEGAVRAPTDWVWALGRTLVNGQDDIPAAHATQDGLRIDGQTGRIPIAATERTAPWPEVFATIRALLAESPPPAADRALLAKARALLNRSQLSSDEGVEVAAGLAEAVEIAKLGDQSGARRGGWLYPQANLGRFGTDYRYRAQIALSGLAALPVDEAIYLRALAPDGRSAFDSRRPWRLRLDGGRSPPVDGFWSLTLYELTSQGQAFLVDNRLDRYAIGDRTPGLVRGDDGSIEIAISAAPPTGAGVNWLPAPTNGAPLMLSFRAYRPHPDLADGRYRLAPVMPAA